jgi:hypothetical protein
MAIEAASLVEDRVSTQLDEVRYRPIVAGAFVAAAFGLVIVSFEISIGLGISSTSLGEIHLPRCHCSQASF